MMRSESRGSHVTRMFMKTRRITISVPDHLARRIKKATVRQSVSAWVTEVVEERLGGAEVDRLWNEFCQSVAPTHDDVREGDAAFKRLTGRIRRRKMA